MIRIVKTDTSGGKRSADEFPADPFVRRWCIALGSSQLRHRRTGDAGKLQVRVGRYSPCCFMKISVCAYVTIWTKPWIPNSSSLRSLLYDLKRSIAQYHTHSVLDPPVRGPTSKSTTQLKNSQSPGLRSQIQRDLTAGLSLRLNIHELLPVAMRSDILRPR